MIFVAWRILTHERRRSALGVGGIFVTILMVFLQIGFFSCVPVGGMTIYDRMRFDIMITSSSYVFQGQTYSFPRRRLYSAKADPDVVQASPVYQATPSWYDENDHRRRDLFLIGVRPADHVFDVPDVERQTASLAADNTLLVDDAVHPVYGPLVSGRATEIGNRLVTLAGTYKLGIGFLGLGVGICNDQNFLRMNPDRQLTAVNLGLVTVAPGADTDAVARRLRSMMPPDVRVFTRAELTAHEVGYWTIRTATGIVFGFGVAMAIIVGLVILYQSLLTQVLRQLPQYATLKSMGYTDRYLAGIVVSLALIMTGLAFAPAIGAATIVYGIVHEATKLPIWMTSGRMLFVLGLTVAITIVSSLSSLGALRRADPVDLF